MHNQISDLKERLSALQAKYDELTAWGSPVYDADHMRLWNRDLDFLRDETFCRAYRKGIQSDHRLAGPDIIDIHIEYRIAMCCWAAWHCRTLPGDFVECGTNTGIMSLAICEYINFNATGKHFYLFDTYEGIPADQILSGEEHAHDQNQNYRSCYEIARRNFTPYPQAVLIKGKIPESLAYQKVEKICYLMLDMNIVTPELKALEFFWDKVVPGGIVLFDDYGWLGYGAQKKAHDEFAKSKGLKIFNLPTGQGMLLKS